MTIYLRNEENLTLVDIEISKVLGDSKDPRNKGYVELHSLVVIDTYTDLLLKNLEVAEVLKSIFQDIQELRGWLWESFLSNKNEASEYGNVVREVRKILSKQVDIINSICTTKVFIVED